MNKFWSNLSSVLKEKGRTQLSLVEECNIPLSTFNKWKNNDTYPRADYVLHFSRALNVSMEYLMTGDNTIDPAINLLKKDPDIRKVVLRLGLHPEIASRALGYIDGRVDALRRT